MNSDLIIIYSILGILVFAFGISIGSFLNVLIYRIPRKIDFIKGRSFCPSCEHSLAAKDLIPIFSWLSLKAKCRYCKAKISARYPALEMACGIAAVLLFSFFEPLHAVFCFALFCVLLCITMIDADTQEIPDSLNIAVAVLAVLSIWLFPGPDLLSRGIGILSVSLLLLIISLFIDGAFGGGDIKLMAAAGLLLGWQGNIVAFFIGILLGGFYGIYLLAKRKKGRKEHFAFGPCLCVGIFAALLCADRIIDWYLSFF